MLQQTGFSLFVNFVILCSRRVGDGTVSGGQRLSHYRGQGEPLRRQGCARVTRPKSPQLTGKGSWGESHVDDQGGSIVAAIMAQFQTAINTGDKPRARRAGPILEQKQLREGKNSCDVSSAISKRPRPW